MNRRAFLIGVVWAGAFYLFPRRVWAIDWREPKVVDKIVKSDEEWRAILKPDQYEVLRNEGTERAFTNPLHAEHRKGVFICAGCDLPLFTSEMKYDSGTGWPSFFDVIKGRVETKTDFKIIYPRTEYHCVRCGGHQGHVFKDGPNPTNLRYCNNGAALKFVVDGE